MSNIQKAEAIVRDLEDKRRSLVQKATELTDERQRVSFAAHTGDQAARKKLDRVNADLALHESEMASILSAIAEANVRVGAAQREAAATEDRAAAKELSAELKRFADHGQKLDVALQAMVEHGQALEQSLIRINQLGSPAPNRAQLDTLGALAIHSSLMQTPWAREFRHLAPRERKTFSSLVQAWCAQIAPSIARRLGTQERAAA